MRDEPRDARLFCHPMNILLRASECMIATTNTASRPQNDFVPKSRHVGRRFAGLPDLWNLIERRSRDAIRFASTVSQRTCVENCFEPVRAGAAVARDDGVPWWFAGQPVDSHDDRSADAGRMPGEPGGRGRVNGMMAGNRIATRRNIFQHVCPTNPQRGGGNHTAVEPEEVAQRV